MTLGWEVFGNNGVVIPLPNTTKHQLSVFSPFVSRPTLQLESVAVHLGWDGLSIVDMTRTVKEFRQLLPGNTQHLLTLTCRKSDVGYLCSILVSYCTSLSFCKIRVQNRQKVCVSLTCKECWCQTIYLCVVISQTYIKITKISK